MQILTPFKMNLLILTLKKAESLEKMKNNADEMQLKNVIEMNRFKKGMHMGDVEY